MGAIELVTGNSRGGKPSVHQLVFGSRRLAAVAYLVMNDRDFDVDGKTSMFSAGRCILECKGPFKFARSV